MMSNALKVFTANPIGNERKKNLDLLQISPASTRLLTCDLATTPTTPTTLV